MRDGFSEPEMQSALPELQLSLGIEEEAPLQQRAKPTTLLGWWYFYTAPKPPPQDASFEARELDRRGRLLSVLILLITIIVIAAAPISILSQKPSMFFALFSAILFNIISIYFNRRGQVMVASFCTIIPMGLGFILGQVLTPGGLTIDSIRIFDLLIEAELLAVALFPPASVFVVALVNSTLIALIITYTPHNADLELQLGVNRYGVILLPILLQVVVALPAYLLVSSIHRALKRADAVTLLERSMREQSYVIAKQAHILMEQRRQLDDGMQQILRMHNQAARGDFNIGALETQDNVLWQIGISLNNLLARLQRSRRSELELTQLQYTQSEVIRISHELMMSRMEERNYRSTRATMQHDKLLLDLNELLRTEAMRQR